MLRFFGSLRVGFALCLVAAGGCGGAGPVPVQGTVKLDGKPLAEANIQFIPQDPAGKGALGSSDAKGVFRLSTLRPGDGAFPGNYKVVVQRPIEVEGAPAATPDAAQQAANAGQSKPKRSSITIPPQYSQPDQTILKHNVPNDGDVRLELQSAKR